MDQEDGSPLVSSVQCSVIQYCSETPHVQVPENLENGKPPDKEKGSIENGKTEEAKVAVSSATDEVADSDESTSLDEDNAIISKNETKTEVEEPTNEVATDSTPKSSSPELIERIDELDTAQIKSEPDFDLGNVRIKVEEDASAGAHEAMETLNSEIGGGVDIKEENALEKVKKEVVEEESLTDSIVVKKRGRKSKSAVVNGEVSSTPTPVEEVDEESLGSESDEEVEKPRKRGRCKKNPELIPPHLSSDMALGYRMLLKFLETPQFAVFQRPGLLNTETGDEVKPDRITNLNQIKKKFDENSYIRLEDFVSDVREMLTNVYEAPRNPVVVKRALRLEQVLEQRIAQLPNYLRPKCSLVLSDDEVSNSTKKIRINKGGGFVSLLLERAQMARAEKDREKRKVLAEERKQLKEEQDKDIQDWEKNVLLKDHEDDMKSMWELPQIGHFIHLCANILNIGDVCQYEVERMLLMSQCSDTLDLLITALLSNSLMRAKLDRTPSMPYSIWSPLVRTRVNSWYRAYQREYGNKQKVFEETGVEPEFWEAMGAEENPLDRFYFHEIPFFQRVWILKTLCDVDFVRKKTVYDNIRQQLLEELHGTNLGVDRHGNRYIHFPQFGMTALRIYRQATVFDEDITVADLVESYEGFEERRGEITLDKVFRDIWDVGSKPEPTKRKGKRKRKKQDASVKIKIAPNSTKTLRQSARAKRKVYVDSTDTDGSDTDLATLKNKLTDNQNSQKEKTFISLTVFRLPRDKVTKVNNKKSYYSRKLEREEAERLRAEEREANNVSKLSAFDEEASESTMDIKMDEDDDEDGKENFTVKNLGNLKMVLKKGSEDTTADSSAQEENNFKYTPPASLLPDRNKFFLVVDSVEGLRQLISQFASDDNDLEIINRSALRSGKKCGNKAQAPPSCEVLLIERLQNLLEELESWEMDFIKSMRSIRERLHREYTSHINRATNFVHPNEAYWLKLYEEPPPAPPPEPEPPVVETAPSPEAESISAAPPSPLGGLRPRTRTRQQQQQQIQKIEPDLDEDLDYEALESSESDDNWELPSRKRKKTPVNPPSTPKSTRSRRSPKKISRGHSPASAEGNNDRQSEKGNRALFWSAQSSDPSEELDWETNRQKILEKHNSPRKVLAAGSDIESEMIDVENALRGSKVLLPKSRIPPPPIPGNRKPYFSAAQLKAMAKKKEQEGDQEVQVLQQKIISKKPRPTARAVLKRSAGTQMNDVIELDSDAEPKPLDSPCQEEEYFLTDGLKFCKVDKKIVQEVISDHQALRKLFGDKFDLSKEVHVVRKKKESQPQQQVAATQQQQGVGLLMPMGMMQQTTPSVIRVMSGGQNMVVAGGSIQVAQSQQTVGAETPKPSNLRFIRPQNVGSQAPFMKHTQVAARPPPRLSGPNLVYPTNSVPVQKPGEVPGQVSVVGVFTTSTAIPGQIGYIQVQAGGKQPIVQVQTQPQTKTVVQGTLQSTPNSSASNQNLVRLLSTAQGAIRIPSSGAQQINLVQLSGAPISADGTTIFKTQNIVTSSTAPSNVTVGNIADINTSQAGQVNLVQVQEIGGDPITYVPVQAGLRPTGNLVAVQSPGKVQQTIGTLVRQPSPAGRLVQIQATPPRSQGPLQRPQGQLVQMHVSSGTNIVSRGLNVHSQMQTQTSMRPQTTLVQANASPRMQTAMSQTVSRPLTALQQVNIQASQMTPGSLQGQPRAMTQVARVQTPLQQAPGSIIRVQGQPGQISSAIRPVTSQGAQTQTSGIVKPVTVQMAQPGVARPLGAQLVQVQSSSGMPRPVGAQLVQLQTTPGSGPRPVGPQVVQLQTTGTLSGLTKPMGTHVVQVQTSSPAGITRPIGTQLIQVQASNVVGKPIGTQVLQVQAASPGTNVAKSVGTPVVASQHVMAAAAGGAPRSTALQSAGALPTVQRPMAPQIVQVQSTATLPNATGQVVQVPMAGGKPGYFQFQSVSGQTVNLVPMSTSQGPLPTPTSTAVKTSIPNIVQLHGSTPGFIQVLPAKQGPGGIQLQNATLAQGNIIQLHAATTNANPNLIQFQLQSSQTRPAMTSPNKQTVYSIQLPKTQENAIGSPVRLVSPSPGQTVRFMSADGKPVQSFALPQQSIVRSQGGKAQGSRVFNLQQPVIIRLDEEEEDVKIVSENVSNATTVDILHGELSAKETPEGWRYVVKTSSGHDHILSNEEVEARRSANNGRMC